MARPPQPARLLSSLTLTITRPSILRQFITHWQIARVNAAPAPFTHSKPTGFLLYHTDVDPISVLLYARRGDTGSPCIAHLGSGGWGAEERGVMIRTIADPAPHPSSTLCARTYKTYLHLIS